MNTSSFLSSALWIVTLITSYTNLSTLKLDTHSSLQTRPILSILHVRSWYSDLSFRLWKFDVIECLDNFVCFLWVCRQAHFKNAQCHFLEWAYREQCVHLLVEGTITYFNNISTRSSKQRRQILSKLLLPAALKNLGSNEIQIVPHWIIHST